MKLTVTTPLAIIAEANNVAHVRAEDDTGAFGILPGHADFLTALAISVVSWRDQDGAEHHIAVRGGMLEVNDGEAITIATREAVADDDLIGWRPKCWQLPTPYRGRSDGAHRCAAPLSRRDPADLPVSQPERAPAVPGGAGSAQDGLSHDATAGKP